MLENESLGSTTAWHPTIRNIFRLRTLQHDAMGITEDKTHALCEILASYKRPVVLRGADDNQFAPKFRKFLLRSIDPALLNPEQNIEYIRLWRMVHDLEILRTDATRWKMVLNFAEVIAPHINKADYWILRKALVYRCEDWPQTQGAFQDIRIVAGFTVAALIYGGLHALAWFLHFPPTIEQLLWRIAVCVVMGGVPVTAIAIAMWRRTQSAARGGVRGSCFILLFFMMLAFYALARAYLVVESFINVAHLPPGVYRVPEWAAYFSHFA
ncbi:MAG: hypothetical protein Q9205_007192 [Flavoplaca limonia]